MLSDDQLYEKQIGFAYWYVTHKLLIKSILKVALLTLNFLMISYILYSLIFNSVINQESNLARLRGFVSSLPDYDYLRQFSLPPAISVGSLQTYPNTKGADIVAEIVNSSAVWYATFDYQFQVGDKLTSLRKGFIMPGETKRVMDLAVENGQNVSNLIFSNVVWTKEINFAKLAEEKIKFEVSNVKFIPASELGVTDKVPVNRVTFDLENSSAYGYKNINMLMFLYSGGQIVAVNQLPSGALPSGEKKSFEINFFQNIPNVNKVEIVPEVNIFDQNVFIKY